jgi:hypothetical protein
MFGKCTKYLVILTMFMVICHATASAESTISTYDPSAGASLDPRAEYRAVTKVKPDQPAVSKIRQSPGWAAGFGGLSGYNPIGWGPDCWLPIPAKGQFQIGPRVLFGRVQGEARRGIDATGLQTSIVNFDDHLGFKKTGNVFWSLDALYQFRPRWGIAYSFAPLTMEATHVSEGAFTFMGQAFTAGTSVHSKWERFQHRLGLVFDISRTPNSLTKFFADWLYIQDRLMVGSGLGTASSATWDRTQSAVVLGLEFDKCLKNYRGNTLALKGKGGVAFLDDTVGYEAEAALNYMIPIKTGRFGFVQTGYRWATLKKERTRSMFSTTVDGPFVELGFLF